MTAIAFSQLRKKLGEIIERVYDNDEPITITRADGKNVVIVPARQVDRVRSSKIATSPRCFPHKRELAIKLQRTCRPGGSW